MRVLTISIASLALAACAQNTTPTSPATPAASSTATTAAASAAPPTTSATPASTATSAQPATASATATPGELAPGSAAPDFTAKSHDGIELHLAALKGKPVVVYFYPKDETPGCTKEACSFRDAWKELAKTNVVLIGVSSDSAESHKAFAKHHELPFHLVSDADGAIAKAFGVPSKNGYVARQSFVIGADGNVKKVYRTVDVGKHASEIMADLKP